ncbi:MAG: hypothetical protein ACE5GA_08695, partial [Candidatus Zixiibacteriota bacterium]
MWREFRSGAILKYAVGALIFSFAPLPSLGGGTPVQPDSGQPASGKSPKTKSIRAVRIPDGSVHVDGHLEEEVWSTARFVDGFQQKEP